MIEAGAWVISCYARILGDLQGSRRPGGNDGAAMCN